MESFAYRSQVDEVQQEPSQISDAGGLRFSKKLCSKRMKFMFVVLLMAIMITILVVVLAVVLTRHQVPPQPYSSSSARLNGESSNCTQPPTLENGGVRHRFPMYFVNEDVPYTCTSGYKLVGSNTSVCDKSGLWRWKYQQKAPECKKICSAPPTLKQGTIQDQPPPVYLQSDRVQYQCNEGFHLDQSNSVTCQVNGSWTWETGHPPMCLKGCADPPLVRYATLINSTDQNRPFIAGDTVKYTCNDGYNFTHGHYVTCLSNGTWQGEGNKAPRCLQDIRPKSCLELLGAGYSQSKVYKIYPFGGAGFDIYCDQDTDDGGWDVIQRRLDGNQDFYLGWNNYVIGFGDPNDDYWIGLENIHRITTASPHELRIDLGDFLSLTRFAKYRYFQINSAATNYSLSVGGFSGNAGDGLRRLNGRPFSTYDRDNDGSSNTHCAVKYGGAWWYAACFSGASNLNGEYLRGAHDNKGGVAWLPWRSNYSLKTASMKIRRQSIV
ncbi:unnamed protein product [Clavelina lepadiformis]|uniref:Uncharacterized protein n=1 Tax=Clavelina lepadiformis TaxID=159417 RepID=A0ABP0FN84_CLALP